MINKVDYFEYADRIIENIRKGAFLTVKSHAGLVNTMTIGWGGVNVIWGLPVFIVYVKESRETYKFMENADDFTVSFSFDGSLTKELAFCGTKSYREVDKIKACNLELASGQNVSSPIINNALLHYECKIIYKQKLDKDQMPKKVVDRYYQEEEAHHLYIGEIVNCYTVE